MELIYGTPWQHSGASTVAIHAPPFELVGKSSLCRQSFLHRGIYLTGTIPAPILAMSLAINFALSLDIINSV